MIPTKLSTIDLGQSMLPGCYLSTNTLCSLRIILDLKRLCHNIFDHSSQKLLLRSRRSNSERGNSEEEGYLKEWASSSDLSIKLAFSVLIGVFQVARRRGGSFNAFCSYGLGSSESSQPMESGNSIPEARPIRL